MSYEKKEGEIEQMLRQRLEKKGMLQVTMEKRTVSLACPARGDKGGRGSGKKG